jgi:hypothetical protein
MADPINPAPKPAPAPSAPAPVAPKPPAPAPPKLVVPPEELRLHDIERRLKRLEVAIGVPA